MQTLPIDLKPHKMRQMTTDEYVALTHAQEMYVHILPDGVVVTIPVEEIPAVLNVVTTFRFHWKRYFLSRAHIQFEQLDNERKYSEMRNILASDEELNCFLRWHMAMTSEKYVWNFLRDGEPASE